MATAILTLVGRIARDPELRQSKSGTSVCELTIPVDTGYGDNVTTTWWRATLFGKKAEAAARYLRKGKWVTVSGEPQVRTYEKRDGSPGVSAEMVARDFGFVGNKADDQVADKAPQRTHKKPDYDGGLSDIPF